MDERVCIQTRYFSRQEESSGALAATVVFPHHSPIVPSQNELVTELLVCVCTRFFPKSRSYSLFGVSTPISWLREERSLSEKVSQCNRVG